MPCACWNRCWNCAPNDCAAIDEEDWMVCWDENMRCWACSIKRNEVSAGEGVGNAVGPDDWGNNPMLACMGL